MQQYRYADLYGVGTGVTTRELTIPEAPEQAQYTNLAPDQVVPGNLANSASPNQTRNIIIGVVALLALIVVFGK